jgi:hypothetical protein
MLKNNVKWWWWCVNLRLICVVTSSNVPKEIGDQGNEILIIDWRIKIWENDLLCSEV